MPLTDPTAFAAAAGGHWLAPPSCGALAGVGIDSREDLNGRAFVAIRGERHDGHRHLAEACRRGARIAVVERPPAERLPAGVGVLRVDHTRAALGRLASAWRARLTDTSVIAVTGSVGKTTTKTLIGDALGAAMDGHCARKSFNNEIGLPLTMLECRPHHRFLVVEIGANHPGEVDRLAAIARPDIGVITTIGRAHLAGFGNIATIAREKSRLLAHLAPGGTAIVNGDTPELRGHVDDVTRRVTFGLSPECDLCMTDRGARDGAWWFEVNGAERFRLGLPGRHNAFNALVAVAVGRELCIADEAIDRGLAGSRPVEMRLTRQDLAGVTVFNDAYNANPDSVAAALETFEELAVDAPRRVVILGDMRELGAGEVDLHREVGRRLVEIDRRVPIDLVVLVGQLAAECAVPLRAAWPGDRIEFVGDPADAAGAAALLRPGDAVLLKASRAVALERVVDALVRRAQPALAGPA